MKNVIFPVLLGALFLWIAGGSLLYSKTFCGANSNAIPGFEVFDGSFSYSSTNTFYFEPSDSKAYIPSDTKMALRKIGLYLKSNPFRQLTLSGVYNISEKAQTKSENLGIARANAIKKELIKHGAPRDNINVKGIKTNNSQGGKRKLYGGVLFSFFEDPGSKTAMEIQGAVVAVESKADLIASSITTKASMPQQSIAKKIENSILSEPEKIDDVESVEEDDDAELVTMGKVQNENIYKMRPLNLYFPSNKYKLKLVPELEIYFNELKAFLKANPKTKIYLTGHSDSMGDNPSFNMRLSKLRARAVKEFMEDNGFPSKLIIIDYKGPDEPLADNETEEGRNRNRRVEVRIHD